MRHSCLLLRFVCIGCLLLPVLSLSAQAPPAIQWQKHYGGSNFDEAYIVRTTADSGAVVAGWTYSADGDVYGHHGNFSDYWITKLDKTGVIQWQKCLGGTLSDFTYDIHTTADGGYIVVGVSYSTDGDITGTNKGGGDYWIVKLDAAGNQQWQKMLGGSNNDFAYGVLQTTDGGYIVTGLTDSQDGDITGSHGFGDAWVIKLDATGNLQWQKTFGGSDNDYLYAIQLTRDGGYILAGATLSHDGDVTNNHGNTDYWVVKLDATGALQWQKTLGGSDNEYATSIQQTTDGGYIVGGYSSSQDGDITGNHGADDYWIVKLGSTGNLEWQKSLGGSGIDRAYFLQTTVDGGYIITGSTLSPNGDVSNNHGLNDGWIVKLNSIGNLDWQKAFGGTGDDFIYAVDRTADGGYILAGYSNSHDGDLPGNYGRDDYWVIKLGPDACIPPLASISANRSVICEGDTVVFTANITHEGTATSYQWQVNGVPVNGGRTYSSSTLQNGSQVSCLVTTNTTCATPVQTDTIAITVNPVPVITCHDTTIYAGSSIVLNAVITGSTGAYQWLPVYALNNTTVSNPVATPTRTTTYTLQVTTPEGCAADATETVTVILYPVHIPNAFSPNHDGINDRWQIDGLSYYPGCMVEVYDRDGQLIFHSVDYNQPWDGTLKGKPLPVAAYYYRVTLGSGLPVMAGTVTLLL